MARKMASGSACSDVLGGDSEQAKKGRECALGVKKLAPLSGPDLHIIDALGDEEYLSTMAGSLILLIIGVSLAPFYLTSSTIAAIIIVAITFVTGRHFALSRSQARRRGLVWAAATNKSATPDTSHLPAVYHMYILGSGGHTGEIFEFIKQSYSGHKNLHRRYIITSGDTHSPHIVAKLETLIHDTTQGKPTGTWDIIQVARARRVHQPLWTAWYTSLLSAISIVNALTREPNDRPRQKFGNAFRYPHVIVTNGPGTGFIVCLVAHLLKMLFLVPRNRLKMVYIETWAHISTLSLTGKLFYWADIADLFLVQHKQLAKRIGKPCLQIFKPPSFVRGKNGHEHEQ